MITVGLGGGPGDRMSRYAAGRALALRRGTAPTLDTRGGRYGRDLDLGCFRPPPIMASQARIPSEAHHGHLRHLRRHPRLRPYPWIHPCAWLHRLSSRNVRAMKIYGPRPTLHRERAFTFDGLRKGMAFAQFCRWLGTPYGSDAFADRHWLSQHLQIRLPDGRLPDFIGCYERLDTDWGTVTARLGLPFRPLPKVNGRPQSMVVERHLDHDTAALLRRRYAEDFRLGGYDVGSVRCPGLP